MTIFPQLFKDKKMRYTILSILILVLAFLFFTLWTNNQDTKGLKTIEGLKVYFNNKEIGVVERETTVTDLLSEIEKELEDSTHSDINIDTKALRYEEIILKSPLFTDEEMLIKNLKNSLNYSQRAFSITIDGENVAYLETKAEAETVLEKIKAIYTPKMGENESIEIEKIAFTENIEIKESQAKPDHFMSVDLCVKYLLQGTTEDKLYTVEEGDSLWLIANNNNMTVEEVIQANPDVSPTLIHIGDEVNLIVPKPYLNVEAKYLHSYQESIPYKVIQKTDASIERTRWIVEKSGKLGKKEVTAEVTTTNGLEEARTILNQDILSEPETKIVIKGTKRLPEDNAAVAFLPEGKGELTSRFGWRWGRSHNGVDFGVPTGTPVYSYMAGTITYSGWKNSFGYLVIIDHNNGYETYYAHNSKLLVKKGDTVSKRQKIALSGNTGNSTGPHVHFEIHKDGKTLDPLKYLMSH